MRIFHKQKNERRKNGIYDLEFYWRMFSRSGFCSNDLYCDKVDKIMKTSHKIKLIRRFVRKLITAYPDKELQDYTVITSKKRSSSFGFIWVSFDDRNKRYEVCVFCHVTDRVKQLKPKPPYVYGRMFATPELMNTPQWRTVMRKEFNETVCEFIALRKKYREDYMREKEIWEKEKEINPSLPSSKP